jgi:hypothetical protein
MLKGRDVETKKCGQCYHYDWNGWYNKQCVFHDISVTPESSACSKYSFNERWKQRKKRSEKYSDLKILKKS